MYKGANITNGITGESLPDSIVNNENSSDNNVVLIGAVVGGGGKNIIYNCGIFAELIELDVACLQLLDFCFIVRKTRESRETPKLRIHILLSK